MLGQAYLNVEPKTIELLQPMQNLVCTNAQSVYSYYIKYRYVYSSKVFFICVLRFENVLIIKYAYEGLDDPHVILFNFTN